MVTSDVQVRNPLKVEIVWDVRGVFYATHLQIIGLFYRQVKKIAVILVAAKVEHHVSR